MNALEKQGESRSKSNAAKNVKNFSQKQYALSLMKAGLRTGRVSKDEMERFQLQVMDILKDLILRYTKGESTTVTVETAESILNSLFYSIDTGLQDLNDPGAALSVIKNGSVKQIYDKGLKLVTTCFKESKAIYFSMRKDRLKVGLEAYDLTIDEALMVFLNKYGATFDAHNTMASIDYPLLFDDMSIKGIFYIRNYLTTLQLETRFCKLFPDKEIEKVLTAYGRIYSIDYTKTLTNIFELVANASFFSVLSDGNANSLSMTEMQYEVLRRKLSGIGSPELDCLIGETIKTLTHDLHVTENELLEYFTRYKGILKTRLTLALETDSLKKLILLEDVLPDVSEKAIFIDGERMSNESFRELVLRVTEEVDTKVKISIIRSEIHSLEDFLDTLEGDCLFGDEYFHLFTELSDYELGLLAGIIFSDELRDGPLDLPKAVLDGITAEEEWHELLMNFLCGLDTKRLKSIGACMNGVTGIEQVR